MSVRDDRIKVFGQHLPCSHIVVFAYVLLNNSFF